MADFNNSELKSILSRYGVVPDNLVSVVKNVNRELWRVTAPSGGYALKFLLSHEKAQRIASVSEHLHRKGIPVITVLPTVDGNSLVSTERGCFILFPWLEGEQPSLETPGMIERAAVLLAQFHEASRGYVASGGPITDNRLDLNERYLSKLEKMERFREMAHDVDDEFSKLFQSEFSWLHACMRWVLDRLPHTALRDLLAASEHDPLLAHGDYSLKNMLLGSNGELTIIDFDLVSIALPPLDISHLVTWISHHTHSWSLENLNVVLHAYQQVRRLSPEEQELILIDQIFPHRALTLARKHIERNLRTDDSSEKLERILKTDREKIAVLGMGPSLLS